MASFSLLPIALAGLLGSVHCLGMCGGIVGAFSAASPARRPVRIPVVVAGAAASGGGLAARLRAAGGTALVSPAVAGWVRVLGYNIGRLASYALAGAIAGGLAEGLMTGVAGVTGAAHGMQALARLSAWQAAAYWLANVMLIAIGLSVMDAWRGLARVEAAGQWLWARVRPFTARLLPLDSLPKMVAMGMLWGWLPCGMVYSMLVTAMLAGSAFNGAAVMLAFGAGTLPAMLALGSVGQQWRQRLQQRPLRIAAGLIILGFGALGLFRAAHGVPASALDVFCLTHPAAGGT